MQRSMRGLEDLIAGLQSKDRLHRPNQPVGVTYLPRPKIVDEADYRNGGLP